MHLKNYRIIIDENEKYSVDYKDSFESCRKYYSLLQEIIQLANEWNIDTLWWFFEPYLEITWMAENNNFESILDTWLLNNNINHRVVHKLGFYADWYGNNEDELRFGYNTYCLSAKIANLFYKHEKNIKKGKGIENQYVRRCHVLANQLGFNYKKEGILLFKRAILCWLFWFVGHKKAVWIYTRILRQKY